MSTNEELLNRQLEQMTLSPGPKPQRNFSLAADRTETCEHWTRGACTKPGCTLAHHMFPEVVYRAHRNGQKLQQCDHAGGGNGQWGAEICGFAHAEVDYKTKSKRHDVDLIMGQERWRATLMYECKDCVFKTQNLDEIVAHSEKAHKSAGHTGPERTRQEAEKSDERARSDPAGYRARVTSEVPTAEKQAEMLKNWRKDAKQPQQHWSFEAPVQSEEQPQLGGSGAASEDEHD